jgi:hypothetical protein
MTMLIRFFFLLSLFLSLFEGEEGVGLLVPT